jgi:hypothetical protein
MVEELPQGYYLDNFQYLVSFVANRYDDILSDQEKSFVSAFANLSDDGQKTLVRLLGRRHDYVRDDKCHYVEILDFATALTELQQQDLLAINRVAEPLVWLNFATRPELLKAFPEAPRSLKKAELCGAIAADHSLPEIIEAMPFNLLEPLCNEQLEVFKLLFFGNLHQDFTDFVLHDLGVVQYEAYSLDTASRYFSSRDLLEQTLAAYQLQALSDAAIVDESLSLADFVREHVLSVQTSEHALQRRYSKVFNRVARQLERESEPDLALEIYDKSSLAPARERQVRLYAEQGQVNAALALCENMLREPSVEAEHEFATMFTHRMLKKFAITEHPPWLPERHQDEFCVEHLDLPYDPELKVEAAVAEYYREQGYLFAEHMENGLLPGLFGLLFWEVIFAPIPGVFFHPFQRGPADIFSERFVRSRSELITAKLQLIHDSTTLLATLLETYATKYGLANHFVMWRYLDADLIELAVKRIPPEHLQTVFKRMLRDLKHNRSGFPDLVLFPEAGGYELVEVKGPGDTLQANQKRWLRCFQANDIPARVAYVTWQT